MSHTVKIDSQLCTGCQTCVDVCFVDVIRWEEAENLPVAAYPVDCQMCGVCERVCPTGAIELIPSWGDRHFPKVLAKERG
jgi:NAD-dependent dihydropyrimidine dehydrogenase PreA subunit